MHMHALIERPHYLRFFHYKYVLMGDSEFFQIPVKCYRPIRELKLDHYIFCFKSCCQKLPQNEKSPANSPFACML